MYNRENNTCDLQDIAIGTVATVTISRFFYNALEITPDIFRYRKI